MSGTVESDSVSRSDPPSWFGSIDQMVLRQRVEMYRASCNPVLTVDSSAHYAHA